MFKNSEYTCKIAIISTKQDQRGCVVISPIDSLNMLIRESFFMVCIVWQHVSPPCRVASLPKTSMSCAVWVLSQLLIYHQFYSDRLTHYQLNILIKSG